VHSGFARFMLRRAVFAALLILLVSSAALVLARLAPPDDGFGTDPAVLLAERERLGLNRPVVEQYVAWLTQTVRLDFGESLRFRRPVSSLIRERAGNTALLGFAALALATAIGIPLGVFTGSRRGGALVAAARGASIVLLSVPPLITSLLLLLLAARTGWLPAGGLPTIPQGASVLDAVSLTLRHLCLPSLALALPIAASLERLQSESMREALGEPCILAALARGVPKGRVIWVHALRLSLKPVLAIYGITVGGVLSGSFAVEVVMSWQGLGDLMYEALKGRDLYLVAGCAATGSACLAACILLSDVALAVVDPRVEEPA
jgi:peptide/nickel transport system permease protein